MRRAVQRPVLPSRIALVLLSVACVASSLVAQKPAPARCLAAGYGRWSPHMPDFLPKFWYETPPHFRLNGNPARLGQPYLSVGPAPVLGADTSWTERSMSSPGMLFTSRTADGLNAWNAPSRDSLELLHDGFPDRLEAGGRWHGDTLLGRAVAYADGGGRPAGSRADFYAIRYACDDLKAAASASAALQRRRSKSKGDFGQAERERRKASLAMEAERNTLRREARPARTPP